LSSSWQAIQCGLWNWAIASRPVPFAFASAASSVVSHVIGMERSLARDKGRRHFREETGVTIRA